MFFFILSILQFIYNNVKMVLNIINMGLFQNEIKIVGKPRNNKTNGVKANIF